MACYVHRNEKPMKCLHYHGARVGEINLMKGTVRAMSALIIAP